MTDPAIDAAKRAWENRYPTLLPFSDGVGDLVIDAAREALKPIRELHTSCVVETMDDRWLGCDGCGDYWPCATARLVYTEEELS